MKKLHLMVLAVILAGPGGLRSAELPIQLYLPEDQLLPGQFKNKPKLEGEWWAIVNDGPSVNAVKTTMVISDPHCQPAETTCPDSDKFMDVSWTPPQPHLIFAVRNLPLQPGPISEALLSVQESLTEPGHHVMGRLQGQEFVIEAAGKHNSQSDAPLQHTITLKIDEQKQVLWDLQRDGAGFWDDPNFSIIWAGDLDQDKRVDLLMILARKYSILPHRLYLSSHAGKGQLVGLAAEHVGGE